MNIQSIIRILYNTRSKQRVVVITAFTVSNMLWTCPFLLQTVLVAHHSAVMICKIHPSNVMRRIYLNQHSVGLNRLMWPQCNEFTKTMKWYQLKSTAITGLVWVVSLVPLTECLWVLLGYGCVTHEWLWAMVASHMNGYEQWLFHSPSRCVDQACRVRVALPLLPMLGTSYPIFVAQACWVLVALLLLPKTAWYGLPPPSHMLF